MLLSIKMKEYLWADVWSCIFLQRIFPLFHLLFFSLFVFSDVLHTFKYR